MHMRTKFKNQIAKLGLLALCLQISGLVSLGVMIAPGAVHASDDPTDVFGTSVSGQIDFVADATIEFDGEISGYKWEDLDADGIWDEGEPALDGWEICISFASAQSFTNESKEALLYPMPGIGVPIPDLECVITGQGEWPTGYYEFTNLEPQVYYLREVLQAGWRQSMGPGTVDLGCDRQSEDNNFGNYQLGMISGYKWEDMDKDGMWDEGEKPLNDWQICLNYERIARPEGEYKLARAALEEENCVWTGAGEWEDGYYEFADLYFGAYTPYEILQSEWTQTAAPDAVTIDQSGINSTDNNFGNFYKYPDLAVYKDDGTGTAQPGETLVYTIQVQNDGDRDATNVTVKDHIDSALSYVSDNAASLPGFIAGPVKSIEGGETYYTWTFGALAVGESFEFDVDMVVSASMPVGLNVVNNTVEVFTEDDSNPDNI